MTVIKGNKKNTHQLALPISEGDTKLPQKSVLLKASHVKKGRTVYMKQVKPFSRSPVEPNKTEAAPLRQQKKSPTPISATPTPTQPQQQQVPNIMAEKERLLDQAREEIEHFKTNELQAIENEKKNIFEDAHQAGFEQGKDAATKELEHLIVSFKEALNSIETEKKNILENAKPGIVELGFAIAQKIIQKTLDQDSATFENILHEAISRVTEKDKVTVRVNADDYGDTQAYKENFKKELSEFKHIEFRVDPDIERGGCIIETNLGFIDSSISTKLSIIKTAFEQIEVVENNNIEPTEPMHTEEEDINNETPTEEEHAFFEEEENKESLEIETAEENDDLDDLDLDEFESE